MRNVIVACVIGLAAIAWAAGPTSLPATKPTSQPASKPAMYVLTTNEAAMLKELRRFQVVVQETIVAAEKRDAGTVNKLRNETVTAFSAFSHIAGDGRLGSIFRIGETAIRDTWALSSFFDMNRKVAPADKKQFEIDLAERVKTLKADAGRFNDAMKPTTSAPWPQPPK